MRVLLKFSEKNITTIDVLLESSLHAPAEEVAPAPHPPPCEFCTALAAIIIGLLLILPVLPF
jgi:hypothetical protein